MNTKCCGMCRYFLTFADRQPTSPKRGVCEFEPPDAFIVIDRATAEDFGTTCNCFEARAEGEPIKVHPHG